ncbi:hypothetical protein [Phenylobacterium sp.]|uniref:hypothetical protein n=1 Tax=Phenylobacterium sp. TaxID=1871053 RepID=UPI0027368986|nr:hypothetical protein [Phenylobacterium sp.]MDP3854554.1 hypothetical protein [Phenylobacterium sp.]
MSKLSLSFFTVAALCGLAGMVFGAVMGITEDFTLAPSHAHLNLLGWVSLALMGTFYAMSGRGGRLGWINFALSSAGAILMSVSLALFLGGAKPFLTGVMAGTLIAVLGMLAFVASVARSWGRSSPAA